MSSKPLAHSELLGPLQNLLETLAQDLTEQKFIPALRSELGRLLASLENLQKSEETLHQIARGTERLREVFAPAGTRLLESVKDLEATMRSGGSELHARAGGILDELTRVFERHETQLRQEAGLVQEQVSAGRDAFARATAEIEDRLNSFKSRIEDLCRHTEERVAECAAVAATADTHDSVTSSPAAAHSAQPSDIHLKDLFVRTGLSVTEGLQHHREEIQAVLKESLADHGQQINELSQAVESALSALGPRVQGEVRAILHRLETQFQARIAVESKRPSGAESSKRSAAADSTSHTTLAATVTASEARLAQHLADLQEAIAADQKRLLDVFTEHLRRATAEHSERLARESRAVSASLTRLQEIVGELSSSRHDTPRALSEALAPFAAAIDEQTRAAAAIHENLTAVQSRALSIEQKADQDRSTLSQILAALTRAEQAATAATELAVSNGRASREVVETGLKDLRSRVDQGITKGSAMIEDARGALVQAFAEELNSLRESLKLALTSVTDTLTDHLRSLHNAVNSARQAELAAHQTQQAELSRLGSDVRKQWEEFQASATGILTDIAGQVRSASGEAASLRARQDQMSSTLQEAIRSHYDDNAARLKEVIDAAFESFVQQVGTIPQSLDSYARMIQSFHQADQLALQAIASDSKTMLALATEKFEHLLGDNAATKKYFPILDRKLEKHASELDHLHKEQSRHEKDFAEFRTVFSKAKQSQDEQALELEEELLTFRSQSAERHQAVKDDLSRIEARLRAVAEDDLTSFRRELSALFATKFETIESATQEQLESLRHDLFRQMSSERSKRNRVYLLLGLLAVLAIAVQLSLFLLKNPEVLR